MKKYTFEDWLNDKIDYKLPGGTDIIEASNGLFTLYKGENLMTKEDYEQIKKCQLEAYDSAVEQSVKSYTRHFEETYNQSPYKNVYLNNEINLIEGIVNEKPKILNGVLRGSKDWSCIKGSEYQKIMKNKHFIDNGKSKSFDAYYYNDNMRITAFYRYLQRLKEFVKFCKESEPIVDIAYLRLIFKRYREWFANEQDTWIERFVYPNQIQVSPIEIESKVNEDGNNRLVLIGILSAIQEATGAGFNFDTFVFKRFGILRFKHAKSAHKDKPFFLKIFKECSDILKK
jgi:hypothetical protein